MLVIVAKGAALAVFGPRGILRDDVERQLSDRGQPLAGVLLHVPDRILVLERIDLPGQCFKLREEQWMSENRPAMNDQRRGLARAHSSSADREASRSTSTSPVSA